MIKVLISIAAVMLFGSVASANLVINGGFETGDSTGWTVTYSQASLDFINGPGGIPTVQVQNGNWVPPYEGSWSVVFGGPDFDTISQSIATAPGTTYKLSFWVNDEGNTPATLIAKWNDAPVTTLDWGNTTSTWTQYNANVVGTGSDTLAFSAYGFNWWTSLDSVSLNAAPMPEPVTMTLVGMGIAGLGSYLRRRARAKA